MIIDVRICRPKCPKTRFSVTLSLQPWGPETFHARFPVLVSLYSYPLRHSWLRPKNCQPAAKTKHSTAHQKKSIGTLDQEPITLVLLVCTLRHGGHVGGQEQKHISPLGC